MQHRTIRNIDSLLLSLAQEDGSQPVQKPQLDVAGPASTSATGGGSATAQSAAGMQQSATAILEPQEEDHPLPVGMRGSASPRRRAMVQAFTPFAPESLEEAGLTVSEVMNLILRFLQNRGTENGFRISLQIGLKFPLVEVLLRQLKLERLLAYKNSIAGGDYIYELTELGRDRAKLLTEQSTYFGTAPVPLEHYIRSVQAQSLEGRKPSLDAIRQAFSDLDISERMLSNVGQAIHSGRGMFLYGAPGNGKTSIAERVTKSFGDSIWIPRSIVASGEVIRLYDPNRHRALGVNEEPDPDVDGRWVQIERPTIVAGGELAMENLEITYIRRTGVGEAPLQMKSNCGTLLIDDFGRQRMSTDELLNRWIVPLEQRHDFLHLESGRTIQVPFDQLIIFSSNLEPRDLVDDAFLRRIPYKIEVKNPSEGEFRNLFVKMARKAGFECSLEEVDYLVQEHYLAVDRPFRFCHPRDLLRQVENRCTLHNLPREISRDAIDQAVENYFSIM